jgi:hypothetical protein
MLFDEIWGGLYRTGLPGRGKSGIISTDYVVKKLLCFEIIFAADQRNDNVRKP